MLMRLTHLLSKYTTFRIVRCAAILLACAITATPCFADLIVNGGFESGDFTGWTKNLAPSGTGLYVNASCPHTGLYSAAFAAALQYDDSIAQTVPTVLDQAYTITFWLYHPQSSSSNSFTATWDGNTILSLVNIGQTAYTKYSFTRTAGADTAVLQFSARDSTQWLYLDDVSVQPVPEPCVLAILGIGIVCLAAKRIALFSPR